MTPANRDRDLDRGRSQFGSISFVRYGRSIERRIDTYGAGLTTWGWTRQRVFDFAPTDRGKLGTQMEGTFRRRSRFRPRCSAIKRADKSDTVFPAGHIPGETNGQTRVPHVNGESVSRAMRRLRAQFEIDAVTIHDMRRCIATWLGEQGTRPDVIDKIQNHAPRDVTRLHYNFAGMDGLVRAALQQWADYVDGIVAEKEVVPACVTACHRSGRVIGCRAGDRKC